MNSTPSRYENIFGVQTVAQSPGFEIDEAAPTSPSGTAREYGVQKAQPDIYSYVGRPGVEYLVTAEYDAAAGDIFDGKAIAVYVESKLTALFIQGHESQLGEFGHREEMDQPGDHDGVQRRGGQWNTRASSQRHGQARLFRRRGHGGVFASRM